MIPKLAEVRRRGLASLAALEKVTKAIGDQLADGKISQAQYNHLFDLLCDVSESLGNVDVVLDELQSVAGERDRLKRAIVAFLPQAQAARFWDLGRIRPWLITTVTFFEGMTK